MSKPEHTCCYLFHHSKTAHHLYATETLVYYYYQYYCFFVVNFCRYYSHQYRQKQQLPITQEDKSYRTVLYWTQAISEIDKQLAEWHTDIAVVSSWLTRLCTTEISILVCNIQTTHTHTHTDLCTTCNWHSILHSINHNVCSLMSACRIGLKIIRTALCCVTYTHLTRELYGKC